MKEKMYDIKDEIYHQSNFKSMKIRTTQSEEISNVGSIKEYWLEAASSNKRKKDFSTYVLVALFPLASTLFAISLGIVTYRYEKGMVYVGTFGVFVWIFYPYNALFIKASTCDTAHIFSYFY